MNLNKQQELLRKYLQGTATPEESEWVEKWYGSFDLLAPASGEQPVTEAVGKSMLAEILGKIRRGKVIQLWQWAARTAAILLMVLLGSWYYYQLESHAASVEYSYITSVPGQHLKVLLPDSSALWLNEQTTIKYDQNSFGKLTREIWVEGGEAYFEVKRDKQRPFIVHSGLLKTRVLGTAFNIKKSDRYNEVQVSVTRGQVQVDNPHGTVAMLTKARQVNYNTQTGQYVLRAINPAYATAWQRTSVELQNVSFQELGEAFYSLYNTRLTADKPEISSYRYTLTLDQRSTAETSLEVIAAIHQLKHRKENEDIILY